MPGFELSKTPGSSALVLVRGEVQGNHVHNFGNIMRYGGTLAVVSTSELEEAMPTVGMPLRYRGRNHEREEGDKHRQNCATWIAEHVSGQSGLEPFTYDVHLLDGAPDQKDSEGFDAVRPHWRSVINQLTTRHPNSPPERSLLWEYEPFKLEDTRLERLGKGGMPENLTRKERLEKLIGGLRSARSPVRFDYATATLLGRHGDLEEAQVRFSHPTQATFTRTAMPEHDTLNADGDAVLQTTEISRRMFAPPIPAELQTVLDGAKTAARHDVEEANEAWDGDMFWAADDGVPDYSIEARLAAIHNLI